MNTKTQTKTIERERKGHYEVDYGDGWERTTKERVSNAIQFSYHRAAPVWDLLHTDEEIRTSQAYYRYVED